MRWKQMRQMPPEKFRRLVGVKPAVFAQMRGAALASESVSRHPVKGAKRGPKPKLGMEDRLLMLLMYDLSTKAWTRRSAGLMDV